MNKNLKLGAISVAVILICGLGAGAYYRFDQLQQKHAFFEQQFNNLQKTLPKAIKITQSTESSLFETTSTFTIEPNIKGIKNDSKLTIQSHFNYGFNYLLTGDISGTATGKLSGSITNAFKGMDKLFDSTITISENDDFISDTKFNDLTAKDDSKIQGIASHFETHQADQTMRADFKIANMLSAKTKGQQQPLFQASGFSVAYSGKVNDIGNNHFEIGLADIHSVIAQIKGFNLSSDSIVHGNDVDVKAQFNIKKIDVANWKDGSVEFAYSMKNIDLASLKTIYAEFKKSPKSSPEDFAKLNTVLLQQGKNMLTHGLDFSINKLAFQSGNNSFDANLQLTLPKSDSFDNVSTEKTLTMHEKLIAKGDVAHVIQQQLIAQYQLLGLSPETIADEFNEQADYENGKATFNKQELTQEQNDNLHIVLSSIDDLIHDRIKPKEPTTETTQTVTETDNSNINKNANEKTDVSNVKNDNQKDVVKNASNNSNDKVNTKVSVTTTTATPVTTTVTVKNK